MTHTTEDLGPLRKLATLTIPATTLAGYETDVLKDFAANVRLPGFRPGHAPRDLVKRQYGKAVEGEVVNRLLTESSKYLDAKFTQGIQKIIKAEGLENLTPGADAVLKFTFDLTPEVTLPEYKGLDIPLEASAVTDEEVQKALGDFRSAQAKFEVVDRAAENGDYVKLSYAGAVDGKPVKEIAPKAYLYGTHSATWEEVGPANTVGIPEIANGLAGKKPGDKATFTHAFPAGEECPFEELRGKTATYEIEVFEVRAKIPPELNEEFFKSVQAADLDDLKKQLRDRILQRKESEAAFARRQKAVETIVSQTPAFPLPESTVEQTSKAIFLNNARARITSEEDAKKLAESFEEEVKKARPEAETALRESFVLLAIAKKENLKITREEFSRIISLSAYQAGENDVRKYARTVMDDPELYTAHSEQALKSAAIRFILDNLKK